MNRTAKKAGLREVIRFLGILSREVGASPHFWIARPSEGPHRKRVAAPFLLAAGGVAT